MWVTTKDGRQVNTDWFDKDRQIAENKKEADKRNNPLKSIDNKSILVFQGGKESAIVIQKEGKKYTVFQATGNKMKYRLNKETGEVQASPYWNVIKGMYLK